MKNSASASRYCCCLSYKNALICYHTISYIVCYGLSHMDVNIWFYVYACIYELLLCNEIPTNYTYLSGVDIYK